MKRLSNLCLATVAAAIFGWSAPALAGDCQTVGSEISCSFHVSQGGLEGQTMGLVRQVNLTATLQASMTQIDHYLQEELIQSPEIVAQVEVITSGSPIRWTIRLQPQIFVIQGADGKLALDSQRGNVKLNILAIEGDLPSWLRTAVKNYLNTSEEVKRQLTPHAQNLVDQVNLYL